jgi:UDPglucose 6-dehydrogenase
VDRDPARIAAWNSKHLPIHENGLSDIVRIARDGSQACSFINSPTTHARSESESETDDSRSSDELIRIPAREPNLFFSTQVARCISEADMILITVNTPTKTRGRGAGRATDVTTLEGATTEIALHAKPGAILVEKSTVPCGTAELIRGVIEGDDRC